MKLEKVDSHLDACGIAEADPESNTISAQYIMPSTQRAPQKTLERLPHLSYSLYKDNALRRKLSELGISSAGSRPTLERRHGEWVTLWNANCDASKPRRKRELLDELNVWERTQGARIALSNNGLDAGSQVMRKDFDGAGWATKHDTSFQDLIASARRKIPVKPEAKLSSSAEVGQLGGERIAGGIALENESEKEAANGEMTFEDIAVKGTLCQNGVSELDISAHGERVGQSCGISSNP